MGKASMHPRSRTSANHNKTSRSTKVKCKASMHPNVTQDQEHKSHTKASMHLVSLTSRFVCVFPSLQNGIEYSKGF